MKILEMDIEGFRSLRKVTWAPGDLNVIIGPNGSGKSNLLRMLELISASAQGRLGKHIQRAGGMDPLLWDGKATEVRWKLRTCSPVDAKVEASQASATYDVVLPRLGNSGACYVGRESMASEIGVPPAKWFEREGDRATIFRGKDREILIPVNHLPADETLLSMLTSSLLTSPLNIDEQMPAYRQELSVWSVYHDIHVNQDAAIRQASVARMERRVDPDGQNLISVLHTLYTGDREFKNEINAAMRAAFGDDFDELVFPPAADQRIQLRLRWKSLSREQSAADLSDGTLRFLLLLTVLASPDPAPVIAIDEPETGLHPSMLPIIGEYAIEASRRSQVILTTHSPQVLDAFTSTLPTTTVARWADGQTVLKTLVGDELREWLKGYSLGQLFKSGELESMA